MEDVRWEHFKSWLWAEWLQPERDTPYAVLALRRIAEFEQYAESPSHLLGPQNTVSIDQIGASLEFPYGHAAHNLLPA